MFTHKYLNYKHLTGIAVTLLFFKGTLKLEVLETQLDPDIENRRVFLSCVDIMGTIQT